MCFQPLSPICLRSAAVFPAHCGVFGSDVWLLYQPQSYRASSSCCFLKFRPSVFTHRLHYLQLFSQTNSSFILRFLYHLQFHPSSPHREITHLYDQTKDLGHTSELLPTPSSSFMHCFQTEKEKQVQSQRLPRTQISSHFGAPVSQRSGCHDERFLFCCQQQQVPKYL